MSVRRERGHIHTHETAEQRAVRMELGPLGTAPERRSLAFAEGQRFATAGRTITPAAIAFVQGVASARGNTAPPGLVLGYALGLVPLVDERIVAVRPAGHVTLERTVRVGDAIQVEASMDEVEPLDDGSDIVRMNCKVVNQWTEQVGHIKVDALVNCRSGQSAASREQDFVKKESAAAVPG